MKVSALTTVVFMFLISLLNGQSTIEEEYLVQNVVDKFNKNVKSEIYIDGWRIKIINTNNRREMEGALAKFKQLYPFKTAVSSYQNPYYSIRTGAYEKRVDLEKFLMELKANFPHVIPIRDKILKSEIVEAISNER